MLKWAACVYLSRRRCSQPIISVRHYSFCCVIAFWGRTRWMVTHRWVWCVGSVYCHAPLMYIGGVCACLSGWVLGLYYWVLPIEFYLRVVYVNNSFVQRVFFKSLSKNSECQRVFRKEDTLKWRQTLKPETLTLSWSGLCGVPR